VGVVAEEEFIKQHNYELFSWAARFFKEFQKEEYVLYLSPKTGDIIHFNHKIEDIEPRETLQKDIAKAKVGDFLKNTYGLNLAEYEFNEEKIKSFDKRTDYSFSWKKKGVFIPWKNGQGTAKLLCGATISGTEIRNFYRSELDIPEKFSRYIEKQLAFGAYLSSFSYVFFLILLVLSIYLLVKKRQEVSLRIVKNWFIYLAGFIYIINIAYVLNNLQLVLNGYPTSVSMSTYIGLYLLQSMMCVLFLSLNFTIPGMVGETLQQEILPQRRASSILHYIKSTFCNRGMARAITLGYLLFVILLGAQSAIFALGQKYMGVWKEWITLTQFSSARIPLLTAFAIGITASLTEEIVFRLFGISWGKKYLKNTVLAVVLSSLIWGFGHTQYAIFPVWFRGIEVSILGFFYGFIFIKYGIIPLIVAHYLFDVFWGTAAYILGRSQPDLFIGSIFLLAIPLIFAAFFYLANRKEKEKEIKLALSTNQEYNLNILVNFVLLKKSQGCSAEEIKKELIGHGWDFTLVDLAIAQSFKSG
jgi:membrane protease YdiL (CAAX protease family)